jgi:hypothetical protein
MESRPNEIGGLSHRGNYLPLVLPLVLAASSAAASAIIDTIFTALLHRRLAHDGDSGTTRSNAACLLSR